jgi:hypothetical protein
VGRLGLSKQAQEENPEKWTQQCRSLSLKDNTMP